VLFSTYSPIVKKSRCRLPRLRRWQSRLFEQNATEREKERDWLAERIGFELVIAFRRTIALYWPTKCVFRRSCGKQRVHTGESGRLHGAGSSVVSLILWKS
jgi:hypothetical protein